MDKAARLHPLTQQQIKRNKRISLDFGTFKI
jgi:hypothetical protein